MIGILWVRKMISHPPIMVQHVRKCSLNVLVIQGTVTYVLCIERLM